MKILIITQKVDSTDGNLGFFCEWVDYFSREFSEVKVVASYVGEYKNIKNVSVFSTGKEKGINRFYRYLNFYKYLIREISSVDVVFVHMIPAWVLLAWPIAFLFRKKIYLWYMHKSVTISLRLAVLLVKNIFSASKESFRINTKKLIITGHGIDTGLFKFKERIMFSENLKILTVGRVSASKDLIFLIDVVDNIKKLSGPNIKINFDIVGSPITKEDFKYDLLLRQIIKDKNINSEVSFLGAIDHSDLPEIYWGHDVFVHVGANGSLDKVVLEAMACGLRVVTCSQTFKQIVPDNYFAEYDVENFSKKVLTVSNQEEILKMATYVRTNHGLDNLVKKIHGKISGHQNVISA